MTGLEGGLLLIVLGTLPWIVWEVLRRSRPRRWDWPWAPGAVEVTSPRRCSPTEWNAILEKLSRLGTALRAIGESPATVGVFVEHSGGDLETALDGVTGVQDLARELSTEPAAIVICRLGAEPGRYHPAVLATAPARWRMNLGGLDWRAVKARAERETNDPSAVTMTGLSAVTMRPARPSWARTSPPSPRPAGGGDLPCWHGTRYRS